MPRTPLKLIYFACLICLAACAEDDSPIQPIELSDEIEASLTQLAESGEIVEVTFLSTSNPPQTDQIASISASIRAAAAAAGGTLLGDVLRVEDPLIDNPALPKNVESLHADLVVLVSFPDATGLRKHLLSGGLTQALDKIDVSSKTQVWTVPTGFPPGSPPATLFGRVPTRPSPAFWHINAISVDFAEVGSLLQFVQTNTPRIAAAEGTLTGLLGVEIVVEGQFEHQLLSLTEWPGMDVFSAFHLDTAFVQDIAPLRNKALSSFVEASARLPVQRAEP